MSFEMVLRNLCVLMVIRYCKVSETNRNKAEISETLMKQYALLVQLSSLVVLLLLLNW